MFLNSVRLEVERELKTAGILIGSVSVCRNAYNSTEIDISVHLNGPEEMADFIGLSPESDATHDWVNLSCIDSPHFVGSICTVCGCKKTTIFSLETGESSKFATNNLSCKENMVKDLLRKRH